MGTLKMNVAVLGLGVVGSGVYKQIIENNNKISLESKSKINLSYGLVKEISEEICQTFPKDNLTTNIEIVNTFNNDFNINSNNHYFYTIESLTDNYNVLFNNNDNKCLDKESIIIKSIDNTLIAYNYDIVNLNIELPLSSSVKYKFKPRIWILVYILFIDIRF